MIELIVTSSLWDHMASQELYTLIVGEKFVSFSSPLGPSFLNLTLAHPQTEHVESSVEK